MQRRPINDFFTVSPRLSSLLWTLAKTFYLVGETVLALWQGPWVAFQLPLKRGRQTVSAAKKDHSKCWIVGIWCYVEIYKWNYKSRHHWKAIVLTILYYTNILYYTIPYYTDIDIVYQYRVPSLFHGSFQAINTQTSLHYATARCLMFLQSTGTYLLCSRSS